jgi:deoxycytidylate deaminase
MTETNPNLEHTARIMFATLNSVYQLHAAVELEAEDDSIIAACQHCSSIAEAIIHYPCPTVRLLLSDMVVEAAPEDEPANEETPAE